MLLASCGQRSSLRLATYNLHHCASPETGLVVYDGIAEVIGGMKADAVAIQELDSCTVRAAEYQVKELADRCGMEGIFCPTIPLGSGKYGIGMLYRKGLQLRRTDFIRLPGQEPRAALIAEFRDFVYICTHFCHRADSNRVASLKLIGAYVESNYGGGKLPVFLAGDLNDSAINTPMGRELWESWTLLSVESPTFSGKSRIDYILQYKGAGPQALRHESFIPSLPGIDLLTVSDHSPVVSDISF